MMKVSRNDTCPCGSGKKYKKCCGKNTVVTIDHLIDKELDNVQGEIIQFALYHYEFFIEEYLEEYYARLELPEEVEDAFHFFSVLWIITKADLGNGKTILEEYLGKNLNKQKRGRTKEIVRSWTEAKPSISVILEQDKDYALTLKDLFTEEIMKIKVKNEEHEVSIGGLMLSIIVPSVNTMMFFGTGLDMPSEKTEKLSKRIKALYETSELSPTEFVLNNFLDMIELFIFGDMEVTVDEVDWDTPAQYEVAKLLEEKILNYWQVDSISLLGFVLWKKYCERKNPRIQKPTLYVAAMIYLLDQLVPFGEELTQSQLAKDLNLSSGSISTKFKDLENVLWEDLIEISSKLAEDMDDFDEEDYFEYTDTHDLFNHNQSRSKSANKEEAQDLIYQAYESSGEKRKLLAEKALSLDPHHPDAYNILADFAYDSVEILKRGLIVGEQELGKKFFKENKGHFWGLIETRPYMRVKLNLALCLQDEGRGREAIEHYKELLELNPNDNQGVRYHLFKAFVEEERLDEAEDILKGYDESGTTTGDYNALLLELIKNGTTLKAKELLKQAQNTNLFAVKYLINSKKIPTFIPDMYQPGYENEAIMYADDHFYLWEMDEKITKWLVKNEKK